MKPTFIVTIEKLVFGGQGLARLPESNDVRTSGKVAFVWNALPGEEVEIELIKNKKTYFEAIAVKVLKPSPERVEPLEDHFLSTSPWQIMDPEREAYWKKAIALETYGKIGGLILRPDQVEIVSDDDNHYGYRNKMEYSFAEEEDGTMSLAFFQRGKRHRFAVPESKLADPLLNKTAQLVRNWVNAQKIPYRSLKSLIIRTNNQGESIAALFIKDELPFESYPTLSKEFVGFQLYYSTHKSPASVPTKLMYSEGQDYLIADIFGTKLKFGLLSFFQINIPLFEKALDDIAAFLDPKIPVVDFYSGVGAIGLPLSLNREETILVDSNNEAIEYAQDNIELNERKNCSAQCIPAEDITELISSDKMIILDPPRAGLHERMVNALIAKRPPRILYLSCNLSTQARDLRMLGEYYKPVFIKLYNFFPRTPHIEGLVVLERIG